MTGQDTDCAPGFAGPLRVKPGSRVRLPEGFDPGDRLGLHKKKDGARLPSSGARGCSRSTSGGWQRRTPGCPGRPAGD